MLSEREKSTLASSWYVMYARQEVSESWYYSWFIWIYDNFFTLNRALSSIKKAHEMIVSESSLLTSLVESKNIQLRQKKCDRDFFMFVFGINSIATYHLMIDDGFFLTHSLVWRAFNLFINPFRLVKFSWWNYAARDQYLFPLTQIFTNLMLATLI